MANVDAAFGFVPVRHLSGNGYSRANVYTITSVLISPDVSNNLLEQNIKNFEDIITNSSGKITNTEDWGLRDLSYDINNFKKAFYKYFQLEINGSNIQNITKTLNQNDNILRHLFIKVSQHQELPTKLNHEKN
jgi:small subunit ribosomal protein S6